jgi:hypothetical protein
MARKGRRYTEHPGDQSDHEPHHEGDHYQEHERREDDGDEEDGDSPARHAAIIALRLVGSVRRQPSFTLVHVSNG